MRTFQVLCLILGLGGCAATDTEIPIFRYAKPGATQADFMRDRFACIQEAQQPRSTASFYQGAGRDSFHGAGRAEETVVTNRAVFVSCLAAKGYVETPTGDLVARPAAAVLMTA
jgi:hypothetical protein